MSRGPMVGARRSRGTVGVVECRYGCCRPEKSRRETRRVKRIERAKARAEISGWLQEKS